MRSIVISLIVAALMASGCGGGAQGQPATPFQREEVKNLGDPEVVVVNMTTRQIHVSLSGAASRELTIEPQGTARAQLPRGQYAYHATTKGATPYDGTDDFEPDGRYTWTFVIHRNMPPASGAVLGAIQNGFDTGSFEGAKFDGASIGDPAFRMPPGGTQAGGGWTSYESGWEVRVESGRISAFRFGPNVLSDVGLFDRGDMIGRFGKPDECAPSTNGEPGTVCVYVAHHTAFFVGADGNLKVFLVSNPGG